MFQPIINDIISVWGTMAKTATETFKKLYKPFNPLFIHLFFMIMNKNSFIKWIKII